MKSGGGLPRPILPALSVAHLGVSQTLCDTRLAHYATRLGYTLQALAIYDADQLDRIRHELPYPADPATLTLSFNAAGIADASSADASLRRAQALIEIDLAQYPVLRIALGPRPAAIGEGTHGAPVRQPALTLAVAQVLIEPLLATLSKLRLDDLRLSGIARGRITQPNVSMIASGHHAERHPPIVRLAFTRRGDAQPAGEAGVPAGPRYEHLLVLPESALAALRHCLPVAAYAPNAAGAAGEDTARDVPRLDLIMVPGRIVLGMKAMAIDAVAGLQPGDVVLRALFPGFTSAQLHSHADAEDAPTDADGPHAVAAWGSAGLVRICATVRFDGAAPVIIKETYMSENLDTAFADTGMAFDRGDNLIHVGELELPVQFEIDTLAMPLSQLSTLGPGYVIEFPVPFKEARLRLVAHGTTIGYGELVTVGDHLGVRIVRMAHNRVVPTGADDGAI